MRIELKIKFGKSEEMAKFEVFNSNGELKCCANGMTINGIEQADHTTLNYFRTNKSRLIEKYNSAVMFDSSVNSILIKEK